MHLRHLSVAATTVVAAALAVPGAAQARPLSPGDGAPTTRAHQGSSAVDLSTTLPEASARLEAQAERSPSPDSARESLSADLAAAGAAAADAAAAAAAEAPFAPFLHVSDAGGTTVVRVDTDGGSSTAPTTYPTRGDSAVGPAGDSLAFSDIPSSGQTVRRYFGATGESRYPASDTAAAWAPAGDGFVQLRDGKVWAQSTNPALPAVDLQAPSGVTDATVSPYGELVVRQDTGSGSTLLAGSTPFIGWGGPSSFTDLGLSDYAPGAATLGQEPGAGIFADNDGATYLAFAGSVPGSAEPVLFVDHQDGTPGGTGYTNPVAVADTGFACEDAAAPEFSPDRRMLAYVRATGPVGDECAAYEVHVKVAGANGRYDAGDADEEVLTVTDRAVATTLSWRANNPRAALNRIDGADRYEVSGNTAYYWEAESADAVVVAGGKAYADALTGGPLAAAYGGPVVLTSPTRLLDDTWYAIDWALKPGGTIYVVGGTASVSAAVVTQMRSYGWKVVRIGGADRYEVAVNVAERLDTKRGGLPSTAFVSSGKAFADALVAGPAASLNDGPVLLSNGPTLPAVTAAYLDSLGAGADLYAIGGAGAASIAGDPRTEVVGGATRYDVAGNVAQRFFAGWQVLALADGRNWPDAASGGALMATWQQPVLLTNGTTTLPAATSEQAVLTRESIDVVMGFGGPNSIPQGALTAARTAAGDQTTYFGPDLP